ncbi:17890_t:CDS:2 [Rhizophagus irregularis]|nr:17890_t:CDS:2 [Rhizophagus irregularis]
MGKNIVVLCDGTWNGANSGTNIYKLYKELILEQQHVKYINGVGIGKSALGFIIDGAVALSLDTKIKEGYKYIVEHYNPGDDIWLFGFSRGAYTVRCIVGMIRNCGILKVDQNNTSEQVDERVDHAYLIYRNRDRNYHPEGTGSDEFKKKLSHPDSKKPVIKFLGLWDTVGALGLPIYDIDEGFKYLEFYDQVVPNVVNCACQALAIHERNAFFEPCHIYPNSSRTVTVKETWFPGIHNEIGGGTFLSFGGNERISKATMLWMIEHVVQIGGLLMRDDLEGYRTRLDYGPSWNLINLIFDNYNALFPTPMLKDRVIRLKLDPSEKFLRKDLLYRDGDWLLPFGNHAIQQYNIRQGRK